jgi:hypothetical protein
MTVSELTCIALGMLFNVLTFVLGCSVGISVAKRKESNDVNRNRYESEGFKYYPEDPKE